MISDTTLGSWVAWKLTELLVLDDGIGKRCTAGKIGTARVNGPYIV